MENREDGVSQAVIEDFVEHLLPRLMEIKAKVEAGEKLSEGDIEILDQAIDRPKKLGEFLEEHEQYKPLMAQVLNLYEEITEKALQNEQQA